MIPPEAPVASAALHLGSGLLCLCVGAAILALGRGLTAWMLALAPVAAAAWALAVWLTPEAAFFGAAGLMEIARDAAWFALLLHLCHRTAGEQARPLMWRFALAGIPLLVLAALSMLAYGDALELPALAAPAMLARIGVALMLLLLAENLFRNLGEDARWHVNLPCIALGGLAAFDLVLHADAALSRAYSGALLDTRAFLTGMTMPLLVIAAVRIRRWRHRETMPRRAVFHGATLVVVGAFLVGVGTAGEILRRLDAGWGGAAQASLLAGALMAAAVALASRSARSRLRNLIVDQFFTARYDYRREWLRCVATLSSPEDGRPPQIRAIRAVADAADSPGGLLLLREPAIGEVAAGGPAERESREGESGAAAPVSFRWAGSWTMPEASTLVLPDADPLVRRLAASGQVERLDAPGAAPPAELAGLGPLWAAVPLIHDRGGLGGIVLLRPARAPFPLDREAEELLRTLGREVAMYLAERRAAERLAEQRRVQDFAKRFAFVAHDVKTVAAQLGMLLANAEENIADPEFQQDMLTTVRASAARINALILRLGQPGDEPADAPAPATEPAGRLRAIAAAQAHPVRLEAEGLPAGIRAAIAPERFDAAVSHLVNNAADASPPGVPVRVRLRAEAGRLLVDIVDRGQGMSPAFIRDELFRPLSTSKPGGSGIGAWQARELAREAGGDLTVLSRPGEGTTMRLVLPLASSQPSAPAAALPSVEQRA